MAKKNALTIAGTDPSGGAGIQADIKTFYYCRVHGLSVITSLTAQNTQGVKEVFPVPSSFIATQIDAVFEDFSVSAVKTGMLYNENIVQVTAKKLSEYAIKPVVDPIMKATTEDRLSTSSLKEAFTKLIFPYALVVTANIDEAEAFTQRSIKSLKDAEEACRAIHSYGAEFVVVKGGHLDGDNAVDVVFDGKKITRLVSPRYPELVVHGTGCSFAALITGYIAMGKPPSSAIKLAKQHLWGLYSTRYAPGKGAAVIDYTPVLNPTNMPSMKYLENALVLVSSIKKLITILPTSYIPEVGINICYALPNAHSREAICGIDGRIIESSRGLQVCGTVKYGVSKHVASIVLTVMYYNPQYRAAMNVAFSPDTIETCKKAGLLVGSFSRQNEPESVSSSMEWGTHQVIKQLGNIPDVIYDEGGQGKEAMIRLLGTSPQDVLKKIQKIIT